MSIRNVLLAIILLSNVSLAQGNKHKTEAKSSPFILGQAESIHSAILEENRILNIYLPDGYSPDSVKGYPVIYLLDGSADEDFIHIVGLVQFLTMIGAMPKSIVAGIGNVDRRRDFTYPTTIEKDKKDFPTTGGSAKFMLYLEKEVQPFINKKFRTNGTSTIIGQSLGGLLATEILLKKPGMFNNYLIVSPSLWWDNESLLAAAPRLLKNLPGNEMNVFISVGAEGKQMEDDAARLRDLLGKTGKQNLKINFAPLPAENHLTILHNAIYKGLVDLYTAKQK